MDELPRAGLTLRRSCLFQACCRCDLHQLIANGALKLSVLLVTKKMSLAGLVVLTALNIVFTTWIASRVGVPGGFIGILRSGHAR